MTKCLFCDDCSQGSSSTGSIKSDDRFSMSGNTLNVTILGGGEQSSNAIEAISIDGNIQPVTNKTAILGLSAYAKKSDLAGALSSIGSISGYTLPTASTTLKGGVKIGAGLSMASDTLNVTLTEGAILELVGEAFSLAGGSSTASISPVVGGAVVLSTVESDVEGAMWYEL